MESIVCHFRMGTREHVVKVIWRSWENRKLILAR